MAGIITPASLNAMEKPWKDADGNINELNVNMGSISAVGKKNRSWDEVSEASVARLKQIKKKEITEVKSLARPPQAIVTLFDAALICFKLDTDPAAKRDTWRFAQKHLLAYGGGSLGKFGDFDPGTIDRAMMRKLKPLIEGNSETVFDIEKMNHVSTACAGMCMWVKNVYEYGEMMADVEE